MKRVYLCKVKHQIGKVMDKEIKKQQAVVTAHNPKNLNEEYRVGVSFFIFTKEGKHIAYCPSLDLSTSGDTFNDTIGNFYETLQLHIECCAMCNTLHEDLVAHGWSLDKKRITPPSFEDLMKKEEMKSLMDSDADFERLVVPARIPALA